MSLGRTESGKTGVSTGLSPFSLSPSPRRRGVMDEGSRDQREKKKKRSLPRHEGGGGVRGRVARKGEVGQWPVNHRYDVMTRLSFQRLHRRKSFVRSCLPYVSCHTPMRPPLGYRSIPSAGIDTMAPRIRRVLR